MELENHPKIRPIKMKELVEFFKHVGVKSKCTACDNGVFAINVAPDVDGEGSVVRLWISNSAEVMENGTLNPTTQLYPTIYTICTNCGFVRHFSPSRVAGWLREREAEQEAGK